MRSFLGYALNEIDQLTFAIRSFRYSIRLGDLGSACKIYPNVFIYSPRNVEIGDNVTINAFVHMWGAGRIVIGSDTMIAAGAIISSQTHDTNALLEGRKYRATNVMAQVTIGNNVWIGSGAIVLPGVSVGDDSIIGAGAIVTHDVSARTIVAGNPARLLRTLEG